MAETAEIVIPSLFPLMVLSRFMCNYGVLEFYESFSGKVISHLFKVCPAVSGCVLIGFLSSFPVGVMTVCELYEYGNISREEAEATLGPAHNTGPAFPIAVIGGKLFGNFTYGIILYVIQILSSVITSNILSLKLSRGKSIEKNNVKCAYQNFASSITNAVCQSAAGCVNIIGFISFGKLLLAVFNSVLPMNKLYEVLTSSIIEFSSGCFLSASFGGSIGFALCAFSLCFGGFVSILQATAYTSVCGLSLKKCVTYKFMEGGIALILSFLIYYIVF